MIQDIAPHQYDNSYCNRKPNPEDYLMFCRKPGEILAWKREDGIDFPTWQDWKEKGEATYLFSIDNRGYFLPKGTMEDPGLEWIAKRELRTMAPKEQAFAAVTAIQLQHWYESRKFCGECGHTMKQDEKERMLFCPVCGQMEYPKISPAVIVAVTDGDRLLLTKYAGGPYRKYALVAGFAEIGESIEDTVRREVMEEVGLQVKNLRFYKSQPWSLSETLLFGFYAEVEGSREIHLDEQELSVGVWMERDQIPVTYTGDSLTNEMIMRFKEGKESIL